ncbi:MAG: hypothetical protein F4Z65_07330 [Acidobacteria bacterium]|nr:hypothetical protein [Acidobacteriota bacterium]MYA46782.1 hypothetical protein [Acidobacteriota bacterium]MYI37584.1 hypothetical protein [Acidobacteriota bacterium]
MGQTTQTAGSAGLQTGTAAAGREPHGASGVVERLKAKHQAIWDPAQRFNSHTNGGLALRTHRAIRWFERAVREHDFGDTDVAFILYWIAFNSVYGKDLNENGTESDSFGEFLGALIELDERNDIHHAIHDRFKETVEQILEDRYLYDGFWQHANGRFGYADWRARLEQRNAHARGFLQEGKTESFLSTVFGRLYTLRNQLVHGGATQNSALNRDSVRDGASVMGFLVPIFLQIMLSHPEATWGPPWYPPRLSEQ